MPSEKTSTSPTESVRPSLRTRTSAVRAPGPGLRMKSMAQFVVTVSGTRPIIASVAK